MEELIGKKVLVPLNREALGRLPTPPKAKAGTDVLTQPYASSSDLELKNIRDPLNYVHNFCYAVLHSQHLCLRICGEEKWLAMEHMYSLLALLLRKLKISVYLDAQKKMYSNRITDCSIKVYQILQVLQ